MLPSAPIRIRCLDGFLLSGKCWIPTAPPKALVLLHPATGVPQTYLHSRGFPPQAPAHFMAGTGGLTGTAAGLAGRSGAASADQ